MDSTTIFLFNQGFSPLDLVSLILNTVLALAAILAVIISTYTFRKERYSRRALIAPTDDPGYLKYSGDNSSTGELLIKLKNYGTNPANNISCLILLFNDSETETNKNDIKLCDFYIDVFNCFNPLPYQAEFIVKSNLDLFRNVLDYGLVQYLLLDVSYFDIQLNKKFIDRFVWLKNDDGRLVEVPRNVHKFLKNFTYDNKVSKKTNTSIQ